MSLAELPSATARNLLKSEQFNNMFDYMRRNTKCNDLHVLPPDLQTAIYDQMIGIQMPEVQKTINSIFNILSLSKAENSLEILKETLTMQSNLVAIGLLYRDSTNIWWSNASLSSNGSIYANSTSLTASTKTLKSWWHPLIIIETQNSGSSRGELILYLQKPCPLTYKNMRLTTGENWIFLIARSLRPYW